jgi:hypothetical protein
MDVSTPQCTRLTLALDDDLTTKPTISGQKSTGADSVKTGARILCFAWNEWRGKTVSTVKNN